MPIRIALACLALLVTAALSAQSFRDSAYVLVEGDPTKQIRHTRQVVAVWKRGVRVERAP